MNISRRSFAVGLTSLFIAPAIVRAESLMPVKALNPVCIGTITIPDAVRRFDWQVRPGLRLSGNTWAWRGAGGWAIVKALQHVDGRVEIVASERIMCVKANEIRDGRWTRPSVVQPLAGRLLRHQGGYTPMEEVSRRQYELLLAA